MGVTGNPMRPTPNSDGQLDAEWIEETANPHERDALDLELVQRQRPLEHEGTLKALQRMKITRNDLLRYGYSEGCPKCADMRNGNLLTNKAHSDECRYRIYADFEANDDPKGRQVQEELGRVGEY